MLLLPGITPSLPVPKYVLRAQSHMAVRVLDYPPHLVGHKTTLILSQQQTPTVMFRDSVKYLHGIQMVSMYGIEMVSAYRIVFVNAVAVFV